MVGYNVESLDRDVNRTETDPSSAAVAVGAYPNSVTTIPVVNTVANRTNISDWTTTTQNLLGPRNSRDISHRARILNQRPLPTSVAFESRPFPGQTHGSNRY